MRANIPGRVISLGLLSTAACRTADDSAKVKGVVAAMRAEGHRAGPGDAQRPLVHAGIRASAARTSSKRRMKQVVDTDPEVFLSVFDIYAETEMAPWLHEVDKPSLVLTGENDGGCNPRLNQFIAGQLPKSELVILPGSPARNLA